ncbi:aminoacyl-tRNA hydrolase [Candidatus Uhrbacteria bacterium]|nr:aminoacyl-tRNA hydrolase [Candidatus Uhrbacteria bacterium]
MPNAYAQSPTVPESEITVDFVRSSGPGGQKVNKTSSKAQLRWNVGASPAFTDEQKAMIRAAAGGRLNREDEIVLAAEAERSQFQNRGAVVARLQELVAVALTPKKTRRATKVSRAQKRQRLDAKRRHATKKTARKTPPGEW